MDSLPVTPSRDSDKLQVELTERTAEISRMRDQMSQQQNELEQVHSKLKSHEGMKDSLDAASRELVRKDSFCLITCLPIDSNILLNFQNSQYNSYVAKCNVYARLNLTMQHSVVDSH